MKKISFIQVWWFVIYKNFQIEIVFHDLSWSDGLRVISNERMDFNDLKEFDDPMYSMI